MAYSKNSLVILKLILLPAWVILRCIVMFIYFNLVNLRKKKAIKFITLITKTYAQIFHRLFVQISVKTKIKGIRLFDFLGELHKPYHQRLGTLTSLAVFSTVINSCCEFLRIVSMFHIAQHSFQVFQWISTFSKKTLQKLMKVFIIIVFSFFTMNRT